MPRTFQGFAEGQALSLDTLPCPSSLLSLLVFTQQVLLTSFIFPRAGGSGWLVPYYPPVTEPN